MLAQLSSGGNVDTVARIAGMLNRFDDLIDHGAGIVAGPVIVADEFEDATGIDAAASTGETFNAAGYVSNVGSSVDDGTFSQAQGTAHVVGGGLSGRENAGLSFVASQNGELASVKIKTGTVTTAANYHFELWSYNAGSPGAQIGADSATVNLASSTTEYTFTFSSRPALVSGTRYWGVLVDEDGTGYVEVYSTSDQAGFYSGDEAVITSITDNGPAENAGKEWWWEIVNVGPVPALDFRSASIILPSSPANGFFVGRFSASDPDAVEISSDGGVTFDAVTLTDYGDSGSGISVFAGPVSITGGGTDLRCKIAKAAGTELQINAWGLVLGT